MIAMIAQLTGFKKLVHCHNKLADASVAQFACSMTLQSAHARNMSSSFLSPIPGTHNLLLITCKASRSVRNARPVDDVAK